MSEIFGQKQSIKHRLSFLSKPILLVDGIQHEIPKMPFGKPFGIWKVVTENRRLPLYAIDVPVFGVGGNDTYRPQVNFEPYIKNYRVYIEFVTNTGEQVEYRIQPPFGLKANDLKNSPGLFVQTSAQLGSLTLYVHRQDDFYLKKDAKLIIDGNR